MDSERRDTFSELHDEVALAYSTDVRICSDIFKLG
jgi:hypothetical protein